MSALDRWLRDIIEPDEASPRPRKQSSKRWMLDHIIFGLVLGGAVAGFLWGLVEYWYSLGNG